jgi:hypothetical protein
MQPPPAPKPRRRIPWLWIIGSLFVGFVIGFASHVPPSAPAGSVTPQQTLSAAANEQTAVSLDQTNIAGSPQPPVTPIPAETPPTTPPSPHGDIGLTQTSGVWKITVNSIAPTTSDNQFEVPKAGNQFVLINFTALNTGTSAHDMNPFYFTLRDTSGTSYAFAGLTVAKSPDGTVVGGQKLRGDLSYELPKALHQVTLQFDSPDDLDGSQVVQWNLSI